MGTKRRIEYIDALRGFTIILVVLQHIVSIYFRGSGLSPFYLSLQQVRMPLFFFVSGLVFYKVQREWNFKECTQFFRKKITVQVISPAMFMLLYFLYLGIDIEEGILDKSKYGYWFTYTLFTYFIFYITTQKALSCFNITGSRNDLFLLLCAVFISLVAVNHNYWNHNFAALLGVEKWKYYIFFVFGTMAKREFPNFEKILDKYIATLLFAVIFIASNVFSGIFATKYAIIALQTICSISGIVVLFSIFKKLDRQLSSNNKCGKAMQFIGRRTLDIYLIHFFFVYSPIGLFLCEPQFTSSVAKAMYTLFATALVVSLSLAIGAILRINGCVAHLLFGAKRVK